MAVNWETKKLGEICNFYNGLWKGKRPPYISVGVIRNTNFTKDCHLNDSDIAYLEVERGQFESRKLKYGDLILEKSGGGPKQPVGRVVEFNKKNGDFSFSNFTSAIRIKDPGRLDFHFLYTFLKYLYISGVTEKMQSYSTGIRNLNLFEYKNIDISFPSLIKQKQIVKKLKFILENIDKAKKNTEKNLQNSKELLESFLDKIFRESNNNCESITLGKVVKTTQGVQIPKNLQLKEPKDGYKRYLYISDFDNDNNLKYVEDKNSTKIVKENDLIVVNTGATAGKIYKGIDGILSNNLFKVSFDSNIINSNFMYYFVTSKLFRDFQLKIVRGTANPHMGHENFKLTPFNLPNINEQNRQVIKLDSLSEQTRQLEENYKQKLLLLDELKKSVLAKAFAGEL